MIIRILRKLALINEDDNISVTNLIVFVFTFITAFKEFFSGVVITYGGLNWKIESLELSSTLPLLFSLLNYGHKRSETNKLLKEKESQ